MVKIISDDIITKRTNFELELDESSKRLLLHSEFQVLSPTDGSVTEQISCPNTFVIPLEFDEAEKVYTIKVTQEALQDITSMISGWIAQA